MGKKYEELKFTDDFMFCKILTNNEELCKKLLEIVLNVKIKKVVSVNKQKSIDITADAKSVRLDVYVEDEANTVYDVEMQTTAQKDLPKRSRYYQGMIDLNLIEKGERYSELKKSYVIFICLKNPFGKGRHVYTFKNFCMEDKNICLNDDAIKVFISAEGTMEDISDEMKDFLKYLKDGVTNEKYLSSKIDSEVQKARMHQEWRIEYMTLEAKFNEKIEEGKEMIRVKNQKLMSYLAKEHGKEKAFDILTELMQDNEKLDEYYEKYGIE